MKCEIIRKDAEICQRTMKPEQIEAEVSAGRVVLVEKMRDGRLQLIPYWKVGAIVDDPQCFWLVRFGVAIPADEACRLRAFMTPQMIAEAQYAAERTARGISYEDFEKYDKGQILGYNPDGSYVPGPNYADLVAELEAAEEEEEGDEI